MTQPFEIGSQLGDFLRGLLGATRPPTAAKSLPTAGWGRRIGTRDLPELYAPQEVRRFAAVPGGIDNLGLTSHDVFWMPGRGDFEVDFEGYFQVAREDPTTQDWETADVYVNLTDIRLTGHDSQLGPIDVRINSDVVSSGQTFAAGVRGGTAKCRIAAAVTFEATDAGITLFNREPILLMNDAILSIPPVEDPNGKALIYQLPLHSVADPEGRPVAYLTELKYTVGTYLTREQADEIRART